MRVLIDECLPRRVASALVGVDATTVGAAGWAGKSNGELLDLAQDEFDVFVTIDQNLVHQQGLRDRALGVVVITARSNRFDDLSPLLSQVNQAVNEVAAGEIVTVGA